MQPGSILNELFQRHAGVKTTSYDVRRIYFQGAQIRSSVIEEVRRAADANADSPEFQPLLWSSR